MKQIMVVAALLASGCSSAAGAHSDTLRARASFDLHCPSGQLQVVDLDQSVAGVEGCGQRATYVFSSQQGAWVANSPRTEPASPSPATPPAGPQPPPTTPPQ